MVSFTIIGSIVFKFLLISFVIIATIVLLMRYALKAFPKKIVWTIFGALIILPLVCFVARVSIRGFSYPFIMNTYGPADGPEVPIRSIFSFFSHFNQFEKVNDIARSPNDIPNTPQSLGIDGKVHIHLLAKEIIAETAPGVYSNYWTFNGKVPGPFIRIREGDVVELTLENDKTSLHMHSIDLHAVTGPGGGAVATDVNPGESKILTFKALNPGLFVYHCAHSNVATHMSHGMYGMILVEPKEGLLPVNREFYVMQGELYTAGSMGTKGLQLFSAKKMLKGEPEYIVFNGRVGGALTGMQAKKGDRVRIYFGNAGVNLASSLHLIGEIFDTVYPEASMGGALLKNVQTTLVPAGGATIVEFTTQVPGKYILVDHALSRMDHGAYGALTVSGDPSPDIFNGSIDMNMKGH